MVYDERDPITGIKWIDDLIYSLAAISLTCVVMLFLSTNHTPAAIHGIDLVNMNEGQSKVYYILKNACKTHGKEMFANEYDCAKWFIQEHKKEHPEFWAQADLIKASEKLERRKARLISVENTDGIPDGQFFSKCTNTPKYVKEKNRSVFACSDKDNVMYLRQAD